MSNTARVDVTPSIELEYTPGRSDYLIQLILRVDPEIRVMLNTDEVNDLAYALLIARAETNPYRTGVAKRVVR